MSALLDLFKYIKREPFLTDILMVNPNSGWNHKFTNRPTNKTDKKIGLQPEDEAKIKEGLKILQSKIQNVIDTE